MLIEYMAISSSLFPTPMGSIGGATFLNISHFENLRINVMDNIFITLALNEIKLYLKYRCGIEVRCNHDMKIKEQKSI